MQVNHIVVQENYRSDDECKLRDELSIDDSLLFFLPVFIIKQAHKFRLIELILSFLEEN